MTTREKMLARKKDLEKRGGGGGMIYPKKEQYEYVLNPEVPMRNLV